MATIEDRSNDRSHQRVDDTIITVNVTENTDIQFMLIVPTTACIRALTADPQTTCQKRFMQFNQQMIAEQGLNLNTCYENVNSRVIFIS